MDFFGYGTASAAYDKRRHINIILVEFINYQTSVNPNIRNQFVRHLLYESIEDTASFICNDVLNYGEHNFLNLLRKRYEISDSDFTNIMGCIGLKLKVVKSPAGYSRKQNLELLVQMLIARYYMNPKVENEMISINNQIASLALGMNPKFSETEIEKLFQLVPEAMNIYNHESMIQQIENYVILRV